MDPHCVEPGQRRAGCEAGMDAVPELSLAVCMGGTTLRGCNNWAACSDILQERIGPARIEAFLDDEKRVVATAIVLLPEAVADAYSPEADTC